METTSYFIFIFLSISYTQYFQKKFCFYYFAYVFLCTMFQCGESQGIYASCVPNICHLYCGQTMCEFDLFKTAGKISIFLRHHVYGSSQKKGTDVCVQALNPLFLTLNVNRTMLWCVISYFVNKRPVYNITKCQVFILDTNRIAN